METVDYLIIYNFFVINIQYENFIDNWTLISNENVSWLKALKVMKNAYRRADTMKVKGQTT